jgi:hypothetical protein
MKPRSRFGIAYVAKCVSLYLGAATANGTIAEFSQLWSPGTVVAGLALIATYSYGVFDGSSSDNGNPTP